MAGDVDPSEMPPDPASELRRRSNGARPYVLAPQDREPGDDSDEADLPPVKRWQWVMASDMAGPLPPVPWVAEALELAPGLPTMIAGYGYSGKTAAVQSLALAVASGLPAWGQYAVQQGMVRHVDYEQGRRLTQERYQRLARAMGIDMVALGPALGFVSLPREKLDGQEIEALLIAELTGCTLAIVDSFRAGAPGVDENSSEARIPLDMLGRVSEATNCAIIVIHHARKANENDHDPRQVLRGSSALFDACQAVWVFSAKKGEPVIGELAKARITGRTGSLALTIRDMVDPENDSSPDADQRWGLDVSWVDPEREAQRTTDAAVDAMADLVLAFVRAHPGCSGREVRTGVAGNDNRKLASLDRLKRVGAVRNLSKKRGQEWHAVAPRSTSDDTSESTPEG